VKRQCSIGGAVPVKEWNVSRVLRRAFDKAV
jgi:hypothetical protein